MAINILRNETSSRKRPLAEISPASALQTVDPNRRVQEKQKPVEQVPETTRIEIFSKAEAKQVREKFGPLPSVLNRALNETHILRNEFQTIQRLTRGPENALPPAAPLPPTTPMEPGAHPLPNLELTAKNIQTEPVRHPLGPRDGTRPDSFIEKSPIKPINPPPRDSLKIQPPLNRVDGVPDNNRENETKKEPLVVIAPERVRTQNFTSPANPVPSPLNLAQPVTREPRELQRVPSTSENQAGVQFRATPVVLGTASSVRTQEVSHPPITRIREKPSLGEREVENPVGGALPTPLSITSRPKIENLRTADRVNPITSSFENSNLLTSKPQTPTSPVVTLVPERGVPSVPLNKNHVFHIFQKRLREAGVQNFVAEARHAVRSTEVHPATTAINVEQAAFTHLPLKTQEGGGSQTLVNLAGMGEKEPNRGAEIVARTPFHEDNGTRSQTLKVGELEVLAPEKRNVAGENQQDRLRSAPRLSELNQVRRALPANLREHLVRMPTVNILDLVL